MKKHDDETKTVGSDYDSEISKTISKSHAYAIAGAALCFLAMSSSYAFPNDEMAKTFYDLGLSVLSAIVVYKLIERWVNKEYRELRIQEYRSALLHKDSITKILNKNTVEEIMETCLRILFEDNNIAFGVKNLLHYYSKKLPLTLHNYRETVVLEDYNEKYYRLKRVVTYNKRHIPSTIIFKCLLPSSIEEQRRHTLDRTNEENWAFLLHPSDNKLPDEAYKITNLMIGDIPLDPIAPCDVNNEKYIEYIFRIPDSLVGLDSLTKIKFKEEVLQSKTGGYYLLVNNGHINGLKSYFKSEFDHKPHVVIEGINCYQEPDVIVNDDNSIEVFVEDWIFPNSDIVFTWSHTQ